MNTLHLFIAFGAGGAIVGWFVWMPAKVLRMEREHRENVRLAELARQRDAYRRAWIVADVSMTLRSNLIRHPQNVRNN